MSIWHLILILVALDLYFLPSIIAWKRKIARNLGAILLLNLFVGWTIIGWTILLVWAAVEQRRAQPCGERINPADTLRGASSDTLTNGIVR